jgi:hypothetical protein
LPDAAGELVVVVLGGDVVVDADVVVDVVGDVERVVCFVEAEGAAEPSPLSELPQADRASAKATSNTAGARHRRSRRPRGGMATTGGLD